MAHLYTNAVDTLQPMFPLLERDVVEAVVTAVDGDLNQAIEELIAVSETMEAGAEDGSTNPKPSDSAQTASASNLVSVGDEQADRRRIQAGVQSAPQTGSSFEKKYKYPIAEDFLRLPDGYKGPTADSLRTRSTTTSAEQLKEDELLAQMLANETFIQELRRTNMLSDYIDGPMTQGNTAPSHARRSSRMRNPLRRGGSLNDGSVFVDRGDRMGSSVSAADRDDEQASSNEEIGKRLREGWTKMSESARVKLSALAKHFRSRPNRDEYDVLDHFEPLMDESDREFMTDDRNSSKKNGKRNASEEFEHV